jgi:hypothetical protein
MCPGGRLQSENKRPVWSHPKRENTPENSDEAEKKYGDGYDDCPDYDGSNDEFFWKTRTQLHFAHLGDCLLWPYQLLPGYLFNRCRSLALRQQSSAYPSPKVAGLSRRRPVRRLSALNVANWGQQLARDKTQKSPLRQYARRLVFIVGTAGQ